MLLCVGFYEFADLYTESVLRGKTCLGSEL